MDGFDNIICDPTPQTKGRAYQCWTGSFLDPIGTPYIIIRQWRTLFKPYIAVLETDPGHPKYVLYFGCNSSERWPRRRRKTAVDLLRSNNEIIASSTFGTFCSVTAFADLVLVWVWYCVRDRRLSVDLAKAHARSFGHAKRRITADRFMKKSRRPHTAAASMPPRIGILESWKKQSAI